MCNELQVRKRREYWGLLTKNGKQNLKRKNKLKRLAVYQPLQFGGMGKWCLMDGHDDKLC